MVYCCVWDVTVVFVALAACCPVQKNVVPPSAIFEWHECYGQLHAEWWHGRNAVKECLPEISCFPSIFCNLKIKRPNQNKRPHSWIFLPRLFLRSSLPPNRKAYWWKHDFFGGLWVIFLLLLLHVFLMSTLLL